MCCINTIRSEKGRSGRVYNKADVSDRRVTYSTLLAKVLKVRQLLMFAMAGPIAPAARAIPASTGATEPFTWGL